MKKRFLSLLLLISMIMTLVPTNVFAMDTVSIASNQDEVSAGGKITVTLMIPAMDEKACTAAFRIGFNKEVFEVSEFSAPVINGGTKVYSTADEANNAGEVSCSYEGNEQENNLDLSSGVQMVVTFTVKESAPVGEYEFTVDPIKNYAKSLADDGYTTTALFTVPSDLKTSVNVTDNEEEVYTASVSAATEAVNNDGTLSNVTMNVVVNNAFNSAELKLEYDEELLKYESCALVEGQSLPEGDPVEVNGAEGIITIRDYGASYEAGNAYTLTFTSIKGGVANVAVTSAGFSTEEKAETEDLTVATIGSSAAVAINHKITITDSDTNTTTYAYVTPGQGYNFQIPNYSTYYNYTVNVTGGTKTDNGNGSYTISDVTDAVTITYSKTAITYEVTWTDEENLIEGEKESPVNAGEEIVFYLPANVAANGIVDGTNYRVTVTRDETTITPAITTENDKQKVVINGSDVTGNLVIKAYSEIAPATMTTVTIEDSTEIKLNDEAVTGTINVNKGQDLIFTLDKEIGYTYKVEQFVGDATTGTELNINEDDTFTVTVGNQPITIKVTKTLNTTGFDVTKYVQLNGTNMWLVKIGDEAIKTELEADETKRVYTYTESDEVGTKNLFWSDKYKAYCYLVVDNETNIETLKSKILSKLSVDDGIVTAIGYDGNVNQTFKADGEQQVAVIDVNDAQLVWNMYSVVYNDISENVTVQKFLEADMSGNGSLDTNDAAAVVAKIQ